MLYSWMLLDCCESKSRLKWDEEKYEIKIKVASLYLLAPKKVSELKLFDLIAPLHRDDKSISIRIESEKYR